MNEREEKKRKEREVGRMWRDKGRDKERYKGREELQLRGSHTNMKQMELQTHKTRRNNMERGKEST